MIISVDVSSCNLYISTVGLGSRVPLKYCNAILAIIAMFLLAMIVNTRTVFQYRATLLYRYADETTVHVFQWIYQLHKLIM